MSIGLQIAAALVLLLLMNAWQTRNLLPSDGRQPAPDFQLSDLSGRSLRLSDFRGKAVLVHFWATWCTVCRQEFGALKSLWRDLEPNEALITVLSDPENLSELKRLVKSENLDFPILLATENTLRDYRIGAFPTNYYVTPEGNISQVTVGLSTRYSMASRLGCAKR